MVCMYGTVEMDGLIGKLDFNASHQEGPVY